VQNSCTSLQHSTQLFTSLQNFCKTLYILLFTKNVITLFTTFTQLCNTLHNFTNKQRHLYSDVQQFFWNTLQKIYTTLQHFSKHEKISTLVQDLFKENYTQLQKYFKQFYTSVHIFLKLVTKLYTNSTQHNNTNTTLQHYTIIQQHKALQTSQEFTQLNKKLHTLLHNKLRLYNTFFLQNFTNFQQKTFQNFS